MKTRAEEETELRRYLLRELSTGEEEGIEARLFLERAYRERLQAAEDDLIDEYVNGELPPDELERFEAHFLADPLRMEDLKVAEALQGYIATVDRPAPLEQSRDAGSGKPRPWQKLSALLHGGFNWKPLLALAAVALVALGLAWFVVIRRLGSRPGPSPIVQHTGSPEAKEQTPPGGGGPATPSGPQPTLPEPGRGPQETGQVSPPPSPPPPPGENRGREHAANEKGAKWHRTRPARTPSPSAAFFLSPGGLIREVGAGARKEGPASGEPVLLRLVLLGDAGHKSYSAALVNDNDEVVHSWGPLKSTPSKVGTVVPVFVPAGLLRPEQYQIKLTADLPSGATKTVGTYRFRVLDP